MSSTIAAHVYDVKDSSNHSYATETVMTEQEAKSRAIKETDYCYVLACAWSGAPNDSICFERIYVKGGGEEIRLAWWKDGNQTNRPADLDTPGWVPLFTNAVEQGVFTAEEQLGMLKSLMR